MLRSQPIVDSSSKKAGVIWQFKLAIQWQFCLELIPAKGCFKIPRHTALIINFTFNREMNKYKDCCEISTTALMKYFKIRHKK